MEMSLTVSSLATELRNRMFVASSIAFAGIFAAPKDV